MPAAGDVAGFTIVTFRTRALVPGAGPVHRGAMIALLRIVFAAALIAAPAAAAPPATPLPQDLRTGIAGSPADLAVTCAAYLSWRSDQVPRAQRARVDAARRTWRARLDRTIGPDESADQYFASAYAVLHDNSRAQVAAASNWCIAHLPRGQ